jgi:hypothetical protein
MSMTAGKSFQMQNYAGYSGHKDPTPMYDISENSEK